MRPLKIRIKWERGRWRAYFDGHDKSWFYSLSLGDMCNVIAKTWPRGATVDDSL